jgi:PAS domain S-box-containing protein
MLAFLSRTIDPAGLTPHGFCLAWEPGLISLQAASDALIALAYYSIPLALLDFVRQRRDLAFPWVFWLFAAFITACGTTHVFGALTLWMPVYWLDGVIKAITATLSLATAVVLWPLIPKALALPSPEELRRINTTLRESEERFRSAMLHSAIGMALVGPSGKWLQVNEAVCQITGYEAEELLGRTFQDITHPEDLDTDLGHVAALLRGETTNYRMEKRYIRKDGSLVWVFLAVSLVRDTAGQPLYFISQIENINERKRTEAELRASEERLRQVEKMTALGQLAGGIAHDFNNILQAVEGGASLIRHHADCRAAVTRLASMIEGAARRGSSVTRRLLAFARLDELCAEPIDTSAMLVGLQEVLTHTLGPTITVRLEVTPELPPMLADGGQLETVLVNLATNARNAMREGGTLTFSARAEVVVEENHSSGLAPGGYVQLAVADTGTGMDAVTLARATEPFFTTQPQGKGTGLGLSMAQGFAEQSGGALMIASEPGKGTTVTLCLPAAHVEADACPTRVDEEEAPDASGTSRILVVDDEAPVREVIAAQLVDRGYQVIEAEDASTALALINAGEQIDLLVSDLSMPGMDGIALIQALQSRGFRVPAILLTGYAVDADALERNGSFTVLRKPTSGHQLNQRVMNLLKAGSIS